MSSENKDHVLLKSSDEINPEHQKLAPTHLLKSRLSYSRDFLSSLSGLDVCKKVPNGFDASILGEFRDASSSTVFDRHRNLGSLSLQSSKRSEHGSVLSNRPGSSSCYARGNQGRWDTWSSGSSDKDHLLLKSSDEINPEHQKLASKHLLKSKLSYSRDFLLSLSELDVCKKVPNGFDASILGEFRGASSSTVFDRHRNLGSLSLQSSKRSEHGSVLSNRPESSSSYARGNQGRWDTWSSGSSDKDGDLQYDREPIVQDPGRRSANQSRRYWQNSEHDGLLGSGALPMPSGYGSSSAPKARGNGHYQLNRSNEPYQPPRPYKTMLYSRKDSTDSYNDETFGSTECSSEDRAEEERKRRESFESMRKEQQKVLQEKHTQNLDNHKANLDNHKANLGADIIALLGNDADTKNMSSTKSDEPLVASLSHDDSSISSLHIQAPASRPLVPPGFGGALVDNNVSILPSSTSVASEARSDVGDKKHSPSGKHNEKDKRNNPVSCLPVGTEKNALRVPSQLPIDTNEKPAIPILSAEIFKHHVDSEKMSDKATVQEANEFWEDDIGIMNEPSFKKGSSSEAVNTVNQDQSTTILEKLFSSALSKNYASSPMSIEHQVVKVDEEKSDHIISESSKFAGWFSEEDKNSEDDFSSRELLSLIVRNDNSSSQVPTPTEKLSEHISPLAFESVVLPLKLSMSSATSAVIGVSEQYLQGDKKAPSSVVLTCEDLEQSILAEVNDNSPSPHHSMQEGWTSYDGKYDKHEAAVDDRASQHILSMLQKGTCLQDSISSSMPDIIESTDCHVKPSFDHISNNVIGRNPEMVHTSKQTLTLEALFGASFMNALHSAEAPVSAQRGSGATINNTDVLQRHGVHSPPADDGFISAASHESSSIMTSHVDVLVLNQTQNNHNVPVPWVGGYGGLSLNAARHGGAGIEEGGAVEIQLPEEDSLITVGDTVNYITTDPFSYKNAHTPEEFLHENRNTEDLNDKIFNSIFRDAERFRTHVSDCPTQLQKDPLEMVDHNDLYYQLHGRSSSQGRPSHQMDQTRPMFPSFDHLAHRNAQLKFVNPDVMHHDPHHPFHGNLVPPHHSFSNMGAPRFDPAAVHPMLQHMPVPGNSTPHHLMQILQRGVPPLHRHNHMPGYLPEVNNMQNFPLHSQHPNYGGGPGMRFPGHVAGGGWGQHPDALERLIEMEMRANSKQLHPPVGVQIPGMHGPANMNFRYR